MSLLKKENKKFSEYGQQLVKEKQLFFRASGDNDGHFLSQSASQFPSFTTVWLSPRPVISLTSLFSPLQSPEFPCLLHSFFFLRLFQSHLPFPPAFVLWTSCFHFGACFPLTCTCKVCPEVWLNCSYQPPLFHYFLAFNPLNNQLIFQADNWQCEMIGLNWFFSVIFEGFDKTQLHSK